MGSTNHNQPVKRSFRKIGPATLRLGGVLPALLPIVSSSPRALSPLESPAAGATEMAVFGWILFWFSAFVCGGLIGMFLYPLFRFQPSLEESDPDSKRDKILIIGTGVLTALILVTLYLLTQHTLTALHIPQTSAEFVIEIKHDQPQPSACPDPALKTPSEMRGVESDPVLLRFSLTPNNQGFQLSEPHQQPPTAQPADLLAQEDQTTRQTSGALTLLVSRSIGGAKAGPSPQEYLEVDY